MDNPLLNVKGGVLIIGSLLWQDDLGNEKNVRKEWRRKYLDESKKIKVYAPIRYGRVSGGNIYTMTFSNSCRKNLGTAYFIPFRKTVKDFRQLLKEAQELSAAEGMERQLIKSTNNNPWAVIGVQFNNNKISPDVNHLILGSWYKHLKTELDYKLFNHGDFGLGTESPCILQTGQLNFPWVRAVSKEDELKLNEYEFFIATAIRPTPIKYPSINKMATNARGDKERQYFRKNNRHGITTHQDVRILKKL